MVGIGVAACPPCRCDGDAGPCCFPTGTLTLTLQSDSGCPMTGEDVTLVRYNYTGDLHADTDGFNGGPGLDFAAGSNTLQHTPTSGYMWVGTLNMEPGCDLDGYPFGKPASMSASEWISLGIADSICVICYCRTVEGAESWCGEAFCNIATSKYPDPVREFVKQSVVCDGTFTCSSYGVLSGVSFYDENFGSLCCGCDGLPCGGGSQIGGDPLPEECEEGVTVGCCEVTLPETLYATLNDSSDCASFDGSQVITLTYNSGTSKWEGSIAHCSETITMKFYCNGGGSSVNDFRLDVSSTNCGNYSGGTALHPQSGGSCDPLDVDFIVSAPDFPFCACCTGSATDAYLATITA